MGVTNNGYIMIECDEAADKVEERLHVSYLRWLNATTADHSLVVRAGGSTGPIIWKSVADGANFLDIHPLFRWVDGIYVDTLGSGTLMVYLM